MRGEHLEATLVETRKRALSCEAKNGELYKLGIEALDLFDHKGIFDVLTTGEPITKLKRVEMEIWSRTNGTRCWRTASPTRWNERRTSLIGETGETTS